MRGSDNHINEPIIMFSTVLSCNNKENIKPLSTLSQPKPTKEFLQWFVGFVDAEGCFFISHKVNSTSFGFTFKIDLHIDDIEVLEKIAKLLGIGTIYRSKIRNYAGFHVYRLDDIVRVLLPIFEEFPLQTTKNLDFLSWKKAIHIKRNSKRLSTTELNIISDLRRNMNSGRLTIDEKQLANLTKMVNINVYWLIGFCEGEGTFGYKHLVPYFQLAQHKKNLFVLKAIESFILSQQEKSKVTDLSKLNVLYTINKRTDVYSMTVVSVDSLYSCIVPLFDSMPFLTRKSIDLHFWIISVKMHKFGYSFLPEGRKIALQISSGTNKYRYTTSNAENQPTLPSEESITKLFAQPAPFDVLSGMSHFELARKLTISKGGRHGFTVHIYDLESGGKELVGSPFSSYGAGHLAIGLRAGSRAIGRNIDTGKAFKGRYIFSSVPTKINKT